MLREGDMLLVFPEGTRNRDGKARPQLGAARLALEAGVALVPVSIAGSDRIKLLPPRFPKIRVHYGEPIRLDDLPADDLRRASHAATKRWSEAIEAGLAASRRIVLRRRADRSGAGGARAARPGATHARARPDRRRRSRT